MKYEIKVEFENKKHLEKIIKKCYFDDNNGRLLNKNQKHYLEINNEEVESIIFKGLNNMTVKLTNLEIIEGSMRFIVEELDNSIKLIPCSIYCVIENDRYSFY